MKLLAPRTRGDEKHSNGLDSVSHPVHLTTHICAQSAGLQKHTISATTTSQGDVFFLVSNTRVGGNGSQQAGLQVQGALSCGPAPRRLTGARVEENRAPPTHRFLLGVLRPRPAGLAGGGHADVLLLGPTAPQAAVATGGAPMDWLQGHRSDLGVTILRSGGWGGGRSMIHSKLT